MDSKNRKRPSTPVRRSKRLKLITDQPDSGDDANAVQERRCSINHLPLECIQKIISYFPGRQWPRLELVNGKFQSGVLASWRCLKSVHLEEYAGKTLVERDADAGKQSLLSILRMIQFRSPNVHTIDGFRSFSSTLDLDVMEEMAKFRMLKTVNFLDCDFLVKDLGAFLSNSRSRASLEDLCITMSEGSDKANARMTVAAEVAIRRALIDIPGRPGLRLKTFHYIPENRCYPNNLLPALDVSQLGSFSLTDHGFEPAAVAKLLRRCTQLKELTINVNSLLHSWKKHIIGALRSLPSPNLRKLEYRKSRIGSGDEETMETLKQLAQRCPKVEVLNIPGYNFDELLHVIGECFSNVKELDIGACYVSKEAFVGLMIRMGQLKKLGIDYISSDSRPIEDIIVAMAMNTDNLTSLHLGLPPTLTENAMAKLEGMKVKELRVKFQHVEEGTVAVCQRLGPMMVSVDFDRTEINDKLLVAAIGNKAMGQLRRISLGHTYITDLSLHAIGDSCPLLKELDIGGCKAVTANGIQSMIEKCKKLIRLKVAREIPGLRDLIRNSTVTIDTGCYECVRKTYVKGQLHD